MKAVVQRVLGAKLEVEGKLISQIDKGLVVFLGVGKGDEMTDLQKLGGKLSKLRIFEDENERMNLSIKDVNGQILLVSQFTLFGDCKHGNRPSFFDAESPDRANQLYQEMQKYLQGEGVPVEMGVFGGDMKITAINDGPVTIILDSKDFK